jgi:uncharacterized protein YlbG (UPF0298 family)
VLRTSTELIGNGTQQVERSGVVVYLCFAHIGRCARQYSIEPHVHHLASQKERFLQQRRYSTDG